jgi:hypothetical protein
MFWTVLIIHYSMETLGITTLTHIAYSTERKCSAAMTPMLKVVRREYPDAWAQCEPTTTPTMRPKAKTSGVMTMIKYGSVCSGVEAAYGCLALTRLAASVV